MLRIVDVHKTYPSGGQPVTALRGASMHIEDVGFYAVMGRSGSGKSTMLHLAAGLDRPDQGTVVVNGQNLGKMSETKLTTFRRQQLGIVFQKFNLIPTMTAEQNVGLPGLIDGRPKAWIDQRVSELLEQLELTNRRGHRPDAMSGGEQQRVAIARAMLFSPPMLFADEPTGNLDSTSSEKLWRLLSEISTHQNMTVLMVTHEPAAAAHCQRVFVLADGQTRGDFEVNGLDASDVATRCQQLGG